MNRIISGVPIKNEDLEHFVVSNMGDLAEDLQIPSFELEADKEGVKLSSKKIHFHLSVTGDTLTILCRANGLWNFKKSHINRSLSKWIRESLGVTEDL